MQILLIDLFTDLLFGFIDIDFLNRLHIETVVNSKLIWLNFEYSIEYFAYTYIFQDLINLVELINYVLGQGFKIYLMVI